MRLRRSTVLAILSHFVLSPVGAQAKRTVPAVTAADLRTRLFLIADDSMMGRRPGEEGDFKTAAYIASEYKRFGLEPAGENGTFFQTVPFFRVKLDPASRIAVAGTELSFGVDWAPVNLGVALRPLEGASVIYGGSATDTTQWPTADAAEGHVVVLTVGAWNDGRRDFLGTRGINVSGRFRRAAAVALAELDIASPLLLANLRDGALTSDTARNRAIAPVLLVTPRAAATMLGASPEQLSPGAAGKTITGRIGTVSTPVPFAARNVIGILRGSDASLRGEYVSVTAHNDHVGFNHAPVDHDSIRAYLRVKRPMGADTPDSPVTTPEQAAKIRTILDSLRKVNKPRLDSITNGADDDGSGSVALLEIAEELASRAKHPRRSIIFTSHTGEEYGLIGSGWFTDHATVPIDSIIGELDMDMIGRGGATDLPEGGVGYLEVVGAKRLSVEFGNVLEATNAKQPVPFTFNYTYDAPGHPLQYYCRADHYNYARYGIPAVAFSRGEHLDYHQVTDEPQYMDYDVMARVASFVRDAAVELANRDRRPALDKPKGDPHAQCRQ
ncbi:MAG: M28 family peptidase [Gemmatimonadota bacterium]|nr:M28 family peptidase [Gemmatimonadota bacterium]